MPKRTGLDPEETNNLFKRTDKAPEKPAQPPARPVRSKRERKPEDPVSSMGVGLRASEWARLQAVADELGMGAHELAVWALRDFLRRYEGGEIRTTVTTTKKLE